MKKRFFLLICVLALVAVSVLPVCASASTVKYIYNMKGTGANIRSEPSTAKGDLTVLAFKKNGTKLIVESYVNSSWAIVHLASGSDSAYIQRRMLVDNPGQAAKKKAAQKSQKKEAGNTTISNLFSKFKVVTEYPATVRVRNAGTTIPLRWGPSKSCKIMMQCYDNQEVTVLAQGANWYQIRVEDNGYTGFIQKGNLIKE